MDADEIPRVLSEHSGVTRQPEPRNIADRNLGRTRYEMRCSCGERMPWNDDGTAHRAHLATVLAPLVEQAKREGAAEAHDDRCESEYESGAHAWTPCGCSATRSEVESLVAEARKDGWNAAAEDIKSCPGGWINCACTPACGAQKEES